MQNVLWKLAKPTGGGEPAGLSFFYFRGEFQMPNENKPLFRIPLTKSELLGHMRFPANWKNITRCRITS